MKFLITGAAGFIGSHVARRLLSDGHVVVGIDNLAHSAVAAIQQRRLESLGITVRAAEATGPIRQGDFTFIRMDIGERDELIRLCREEQFEQVIHLAAATGNTRCRREPAAAFDINVAGTQNVLEAARISGVEHVFFSSAIEVHGSHATSPLSENDDVDRPLNIFAGTKRAGELLCYAYSQTYHLPVTVFRMSIVYGPWCRPDSYPMALLYEIVEDKPIRIYNNGYLVRDFTYIDDIVDGIGMAIANPPYNAQGAPFELYNVGRSKPVSLISFIQALETALCKNARIVREPASPLSLGEAIETYADTSKLEQQLAYSPVWDYEEAVPLFVSWFQENYGKTFSMQQGLSQTNTPRPQ